MNTSMVNGEYIYKYEHQMFDFISIYICMYINVQPISYDSRYYVMFAIIYDYGKIFSH